MLVELIVVTAIISLLTGLMFANYRGGIRSIAERNSLQSIAHAVRGAQNRALSGSCTVSPCRFGAHFDISSTILNIFEDGAVNMNGQYDIGETIEAIDLEDNISLTDLSSNYACAQSLCADVLFDPPDPIVSFAPAGASSLTISITGGKSVTVGLGGSIDIN